VSINFSNGYSSGLKVCAGRSLHGPTNRKVHAATRSAFTAWSFPQCAFATSGVFRNRVLRTCDLTHVAADGFRTNNACARRKLHDRGIEKNFRAGLISD
jgi:hypothetical protein